MILHKSDRNDRQRLAAELIHGVTIIHNVEANVAWWINWSKPVQLAVDRRDTVASWVNDQYCSDAFRPGVLEIGNNDTRPWSPP